MRMLSNSTTSVGLVVRLAQAQDEGVYRDQHSALAKAVCTYRMHEAVGGQVKFSAATAGLADLTPSFPSIAVICVLTCSFALVYR